MCVSCDVRLMASAVLVETKNSLSLCADTGRGPDLPRAPDCHEWSSREDENGRGELSSIAPPDLVPSGALFTATFNSWPRS